MLTELSGISLPELLTESVSEETNANVPEPITEDEPVRAYTPELLYIDRPLVFRCLSSYINMNELSAESLCPNY